ncbi:YncE family protein [Tepidiforma sp.]|uniref:YncE family protein n=1 Tax=Tepidiforma sp. TaxID=2682230 RepID=UPI0021DEF097|nr:YncE family protein [Tepidiforma sp.]MCX7616615.1 YncE family protein [Tepidiforma sp.]GIW19657.1 MAG: hypothetical protein KatS3mg064_2814 [Tepidiforma sp.]
MRHSSLGRFNRFASLAVLPVMLLAILAFSRQAQRQPAVPAPAEGILAVASLRSGQLTLFDLARGETRTLALPAAPHELEVRAGRLYATLTRADALVELDPRAPGILRRVVLPGRPHGLALDPAAGVLYVTLDDANALVALDAASLAEIARWPTGETPHAVALAGGVPHVAAARAGRVEAVRPSGGAAAEAGRLPESLAAADGLLLAADYLGGTLSLFEPVTLEPRGAIPLGGGPVRILDLGDGTAAVALQEAGQVAVVDLARREVVRRLDVTPRPDGLCRSPSGRYLAVASNGAGTVTVFDTATWRIAARYTVPEGPGACAWLAD